MFAQAEHDLPALGVVVSKPKLDLAAMMKHKDDTVAANVNGVGFLLKKNKVESFHGLGVIKAAGKVDVVADGGNVTSLETRNIVIATGCEAAIPPGVNVQFDEKTIGSSTGAIPLAKKPENSVVMGAGRIGPHALVA